MRQRVCDGLTKLGLRKRVQKPLQNAARTTEPIETDRIGYLRFRGQKKSGKSHKEAQSKANGLRSGRNERSRGKSRQVEGRGDGSSRDQSNEELESAMSGVRMIDNERYKVDPVSLGCPIRKSATMRPFLLSPI